MNKLIVDPGVWLIGIRIVRRPFWIGFFFGRVGYSNKPVGATDNGRTLPLKPP